MVATHDKYALSAFEECLQQALKWYDQPQQLGESSPLAAPYFLSHALQTIPNASNALRRGETLRAEIRQAAATLWGTPLPPNYAAMKSALPEVRKEKETPRYSYLVLEMRYFQEYFKPRSLREIYENEAYLFDSKAGDFRSHKIALQHLGRALLERLQPTLHLEHPRAPAGLVGYQPSVARCLAALRAGQTVALSGAGGVGKTTLGAAIVQQITDQPLFWFTFRPTLNDHLNSLLFALGHFLQQQGAVNLWQLLLAAGGVIQDYQLALVMARQDLAGLAHHPPILCFDELDRLQAAAPEATLPAHVQLLEFIEGLRTATPMLLIGQRPVLEADTHHLLTGLSTPEIVTLWQTAQLPLLAAEADKLYHYTGGNPRLLLLCRALQELGETAADLLATFPTTPGLLPLFNRLWVRLQPDERRLLQQLAVFRALAPDHLWPSSSVQTLRQRRLVELDGQGGVALLPALRDIIYTELSAELRAQLHLAAASALLALGDYTEAAYHYWQGGQPAAAIQAWYPQRQQEIQRGQTDAAWVIFEGIERHPLPEPARKALEIIRAELRQLRGNLTQGLADLEKLDWAEASETNLHIAGLRGDFEDALGYPDRALNTYAQGIQASTRLLNQINRFYYRSSLLHIGQRNLPQARRAARLAESWLQNLFGKIEEEEGRYTDALISYQKALAIAQSLNDESSSARTARNLANLVGGRLQKLEEAVKYAEQAMTSYARMGDRLNLERTRSNLSFIYLQNKQFVAALQTALKTYTFFKAIQDPYYTAIEAANLAEAYFETGDYANAEQYAYAALEQEEKIAHPYALFTLGRVKGSNGAWAAAEIHFMESARVAQQNDDPYLVAYAQRSLAEALWQGGKRREAAQTLSTALRGFEQLGMETEIAETQKLLDHYADIKTEVSL